MRVWMSSLGEPLVPTAWTPECWVPTGGTPYGMYLGVGDTKDARNSPLEPATEIGATDCGGSETCVRAAVGTVGLGELTLPTDSFPLIISSLTKFAIAVFVH